MRAWSCCILTACVLGVGSCAKAGAAMAVLSTAAAVKSFKFIRHLHCRDEGPTDSESRRSESMPVPLQRRVRLQFPDSVPACHDAAMRAEPEIEDMATGRASQ